MTIRTDSLLLACETLGIDKPKIVDTGGNWWATIQTDNPAGIAWRLARLTCYGWSGFGLDPELDFHADPDILSIRVSGPVADATAARSGIQACLRQIRQTVQRPCKPL